MFFICMKFFFYLFLFMYVYGAGNRKKITTEVKNYANHWFFFTIANHNIMIMHFMFLCNLYIWSFFKYWLFLHKIQSIIVTLRVVHFTRCYGINHRRKISFILILSWLIDFQQSTYKSMDYLFQSNEVFWNLR